MSDLNNTVVAYAVVASTRAMRNMPRFGHSSNFAALFSDDNSEAEDYGRGLLFAGVFIISVFFAWSLILITLKCLGPDRVGFLSGAPFTKPAEKAEFKRPMRCRITFMVAGITLIVFGVLLVTEGVTNVKETIVAVDDSNSEVQLLVNDANDIAASLRSIGKSTEAIRVELASYVGDFCPAEPNIEQETGYDFDGLAGQAIDLLDTLGGFLDNELVTLEDSLKEIEEVTTNVNDGVETIEINDWQSLIILIPIIIIPSFLMVGTMMAWNETTHPIYSCLLNWFFLPLFIIIAVGAYAGSGAVAIAATVNADWCSGSSDMSVTADEFSPDNTVIEILRSSNIDRDELVFRAVEFYVTQCQSDDPWDFVRSYSSEVVNAESQVLDLVDAVDQVTVPRLTALCGRDFGPIRVLLGTIGEDLEVLLASASSVVDLLRCSRIVPIYTTIAYDGTCTYSVTGVTWIWSSLLVIAFCAMLMLTFRSSWQETVYDTPEMYAESMHAAVQHTPTHESSFNEELDDSPVYSEPAYVEPEQQPRRPSEPLPQVQLPHRRHDDNRVAL